MKKSFLLPFAMAVAALINSSPASSKIIESNIPNTPVISRNEDNKSKNELVLSMAQSPISNLEMAWHQSHASHQSHSSHSSHCSGWDYCN